MRCLRATLYGEPSTGMITSVTREPDLNDTLESAAIALREKAAPDGALSLHEIYEVPNGTSIKQATAIGMRRLEKRKQQELNQVLLYFWVIKEWRILREGGTIMMDRPAPLTRPEIAIVLEQLAKHPDYKDFRIVSTDKDGELVVMDKGRIEE